MNKSLIKVLLGAGLAGAALLSLSMASWSMGPGGAGHDPDRMMAHMTERLNLSEEQQEQVTGLMAASKERNTSDKQKLKELREQLSAQKNDFDAGTAQKQATEIGEITGRMVYRAVETQAGIYKILDDEQRAQMDAMVEKRQSRWGEKRAGGKRSKE
jgi:protein CpxP